MSMAHFDSKLIGYWMGQTLDEVAQGHHGSTRASVTEEIRKMIDGIRAEILESILRRAMDGDVSAAEWLESNGFIDLPSITVSGHPDPVDP